MKLKPAIDDDTEPQMATREPESIVMKEGDYLRQRVNIEDIPDDDDEAKTSGCLPHLAPSGGSPDAEPPAPASDELRRRRRCDSEPTPPSPQHSSSFVEKLKDFFRRRSPRRSRSAGGSGRQSPTGRPAAPARRRFVRVVRDAEAPPPELTGDNPNVICRYSQEFLKRHYADEERRRRQTGDGTPPRLPYTTSGHTILKKSSTDPTSYRRVLSDASTTLKHATFCDTVTVVDVDDGKVHEERLHDDEVEQDVTSPAGQTGFFLNATVDLDEDTAAGPDEPDAVILESEAGAPAAVQKDQLVQEPASENMKSMGLMSVFASASGMTPETAGVGDGMEQPVMMSKSMKRVNLTDLMAQLRTDDRRRDDDSS